jgi:ATP synthase protein I
MNDRPKKYPTDDGTNLAGQIGAKAARKLRARNSTQGVWFGLGALLVAGLTIGCANAWYWVDQQQKAMGDRAEDTDE